MSFLSVLFTSSLQVGFFYVKYVKAKFNDIFEIF